MVAKACPDEEFIRLFKALGAQGVAQELSVDRRSVLRRRRSLEAKLLINIDQPNKAANSGDYASAYARRIPYELNDGIVIIGSDSHYWPGRISPAHRGMIRLIEELEPNCVILNGDVFDGASISRFPPIGWEHKPTIREELECVEERLLEIERASKGARRFWNLGNHCMRFENKLSANSPEFKNVKGFMLKDQFPNWEIGVSVWINDDIVVKHRWKGGIHATHNNTLMSGKTFITGHLHSLKITPFSDYNDIRYGIDTGTLEDPYGPQFNYDEDNPKNHRSGFVVLTLCEGKLLWPEVCRVFSETQVEFRGKIIEV